MADPLSRHLVGERAGDEAVLMAVTRWLSAPIVRMLLILGSVSRVTQQG